MSSIRIFDLEIGVSINGKGVSAALKKLEKDGKATDKSLSQIGDGAERSQKKATSAFGRIANSLRSLRKDASRNVEVNVEADAADIELARTALKNFRKEAKNDVEVTVSARTGDALQKLGAIDELKRDVNGNVVVNVDADTAEALAGMNLTRQAAERLDGKTVTIDVDTGDAPDRVSRLSSAMSGLGRAAQGMDSGLSAGGVRIAMIGGIAATAAALFTPLLGGLAALGALGFSAGAGIGLIVGPLTAVTTKLGEYHKVASDAESTTAEIREAAKGLSPAMLTLYDTFIKARDALDSAFGPAQDAISKLSSRVINDAIPAFGILGQTSTKVIGALGQAWDGFVSRLRMPTQRGSLETLLGISPEIVQRLSTTVGNIGLAITNMLAVAAPYALRLASYIENISASLLKWSGSSSGVNAVKTAISAAVPVFQALWNLVLQVGGALFRFGATEAPAIASAIGFVSSALTALINGFAWLTKVIGPAVPIAAALTPIFLGLLLIFGQVGAALASLGGLFPGLVGFLGLTSAAILPAIAIVAGFAAVGILLYKNWESVKSVFSSVASVLGSAFAFLRSAAAPAIAQIQSALTALRYALMPVGMVANSVIRGMLGAAFAFLLSQGRLVMAWWRQNAPLIKTLIAVNFRAAGVIVSTVIRAMAAVIRTVFGGVIAFYRANSTQIRAITSSVWNIVKTIITTTLRVIGGLVRATLLLLTGNWRQAFLTLQQVSQTVMSAIVSILRSLLSILVNAFVIGWNNLKAVTAAAYQAIRDSIVNRITEAKNQAISAIEGLKSSAASAWEAIKSGASSAWKAIAGFITEPIGNAVGTVKGFLNDLIGLVNKVLDAVGLKPLQVSFETGGETTGGRPETGAFARGGNTGGLGTRSKQPRTHLWNEQYGNEAYIVENRPTSEQLPYLKEAASWHDHAVVPTGRSVKNKLGPHARNFAEGGVEGADEALRSGSFTPVGLPLPVYPVPTMVRAFAAGGVGAMYEAVKEKFGVEGFNNHGGYLSGAGATDSLDFMVTTPGNVAQGSEKELGDNIAAFTAPPSAVNTIWYGQANFGSGWQPYETGPGVGNANTLKHMDHVHAQAFPDSFRGAQGNFPGGGGPGGGTMSVPNPMQILFEKMWGNLVKPVVDRVLSPMEDASYVVLQAVGKIARKVPQGIYDWIDEKIPDMIGGSGGGDLPGGKSPSGLTIGEALSQGGWPSNLLTEASSTVWHESTGNARAQNPSGARGLMQIMPQTAEGVGADYDKLYDPVYNTSAGKKVYDQAGGWGPWVGAGQGGDYRNEPVTGYYKGGLAIGPQLLSLAERGKELVLPLENAQVMRSAQTALGTAELRQEMAAMRQDFARIRQQGLKTHITGMDDAPAGKLVAGTQSQVRQLMRGTEGRDIIRGQVGTLDRQIRGRGGRP